MQFLIKTCISAVIIGIVSTVSKKVPAFGAVIVSLPLTSILALIWFYKDTNNTQKVVELSDSICLMVVPSVIFFIALSSLLKHNVKFHSSIIFASVIMIISYSIYTLVLKKIGIHI